MNRICLQQFENCPKMCYKIFVKKEKERKEYPEVFFENWQKEKERKEYPEVFFGNWQLLQQNCKTEKSLFHQKLSKYLVTLTRYINCKWATS